MKSPFPFLGQFKQDRRDRRDRRDRFCQRALAELQLV